MATQNWAEAVNQLLEGPLNQNHNEQDKDNSKKTVRFGSNVTN